MARNFFERYVWLVDLINRHGYIKFEDISRAWAYSRLNCGDSVSMQQSVLPQRTFFNHIDAIFDMFGIEIKCNRDRGYYIANGEDQEEDSARRWLLESVSLNNLLRETRDMRERILFEKIPSSHRWLALVVNAMRDGKVIEMTYQSFWRDEAKEYKAKPYCVKLFKQRWYMLARIEGKKELRVFALDERMKDIHQTDKDYTLPDSFDASKFFADHFGIIVGDDWAPQEVKIRVEKDQVKFVDSLPLHHSQEKVLEESDENYTVYKYFVAPTFDFKQELLSRGPSVEVLAPEAFRLEVKDDVAAMAKNYGL